MTVVAVLSLTLSSAVLLWVERRFAFPRPTFGYAVITVLVANIAGGLAGEMVRIVALPIPLVFDAIVSIGICTWLLKRRFPVSFLRATSAYLASISITIAIVVPLALMIRMFIVSPFVMSGDSMIPTYQNGAYLIVNEIPHNFLRGEVVVSREQDVSAPAFIIKRVIGLPGERIDIRGGVVSANGLSLNEPYSLGSTTPDSVTTLGPDEYFVLGDNRASSTDSRSFGPIRKSDIIGNLITSL